MGYIKYNLCWRSLFNLREEITARLFVYNEKQEVCMLVIINS